jgi:uncharacterized membrane protein YedE/YeeE
MEFTIAWKAFTPWESLAGGALIGLAVAIYLFGAGRVAGVSDVIGDAVGSALNADRFEPDGARWAFLAGLLIAPWLWWLFQPLPDLQADRDVSPMLIVAGGVLVGLGARMAGGCTSGHAVCGLSRFSLRSLVAVLIFVLAGGSLVFAMRHLVFINPFKDKPAATAPAVPAAEPPASAASRAP